MEIVQFHFLLNTPLQKWLTFKKEKQITFWRESHSDEGGCHSPVSHFCTGSPQSRVQATPAG